MRVTLLGLLAVLLFGMVSPPGSASSTAPRNDYLLILDHRAGPFAYLRSFNKGAPDAYSDALAAFGTPSRFKPSYNFCDVTWRSAGITISFASAPKPCAPAQLFGAAWYGMSLWGSRWHNRLGIHVGSSIAEVRRLYPQAKFASDAQSNWLVLLRKRIDEFNFVHLAVAVNRTGRVTSIEVPATYIY